MPLDREASEAAERCLYCPKMCRFSCPVGHESARETLSPWGKMTLLSLTVGAAPEPLGLPGKLELLAQKARRFLDSAPRRELDADSAEAFYGCTGCLRCQTFCDHDNDVSEALYAGRAAAVDAGLEPAAVRAVADRFLRQGHARTEDIAAALAPLAELHRPSSGASSVLFAGCEAPLTGLKGLQATLDVARRLGTPLGVAREPLCCGRPLFEAGYRDAFREHVEDTWERLGDREIVVPSAACARVLTEYARAVGVEPRGEVVHTTTWLASRLGSQVQAPPLAQSVAYHDPCHLGRGLGEYEAPRRLLGAALQSPPREAFGSREKSDCCGASGLVPQTFPDLARAMAMTRADELRATGAVKIATACPACQGALRGAGLEVVDVSEVVQEWLAGGDGRS